MADSMELVTVTFDRVFDITRTSGNRMPGIEFGFEAGALRKYSVAVPGESRIEAGMTVSVVLRGPGDWQTLMGWLDHHTGEISCRSPGLEAGFLMMLAIGSFWATDLWPRRPVLAAFIFAVALCFGMGGVVGMREAVSARRMLRARRSEVLPAAG